MTASKFAVGDRVRAVRDISFYEHVTEGSIGTVIYVDNPTNPDSNMRVDFDDYVGGGNDDNPQNEQERGAYVYPSEVEAAVSSPPPLFKGDRVRSVRTIISWESIPVGTLGTVAEDDDGDGIVYVVFDGFGDTGQVTCYYGDPLGEEAPEVEPVGTPQSAVEQAEGVVTFDLTDPVETALLAALVAHRNQ